tara:strand:+ start:1180 stop:1305 length:126 start_codon:yes stop_codon:yes gene_type:complete
MRQDNNLAVKSENQRADGTSEERSVRKVSQARNVNSFQDFE